MITETTNKIMRENGFADDENTKYVSELREWVRSSVFKYGLTGMHFSRAPGASNEDVAREFLRMEWGLSKGHYCTKELFDESPIQRKYDLTKKKWVWSFNWHLIGPWIIDLWSELKMKYRVWTTFERNPYA